MEFRDLLDDYAAFKKKWSGPIQLGTKEETEYEVEKQKVTTILMAHPDGFDKLLCFMVDVHGGRVMTETYEEIEDKLSEVNECLLEQGPSAISSYSELAQEVCVFLEHFCAAWKGAELTDSGAGCESWHFGCYCTEHVSQVLCRELYRRFATEVRKGVLTIDRHTDWSIRPVEGRT